MKRRNTDIRFWEDQVTRRANEELYPRVTEGCALSREKMICGNVGFVIDRVDRFLRFVPGYSHLRDEMISNGIVGLVEAVNSIAGGVNKVSNPTGLIQLYVNSACGKTIESSQTIRVPSRTQKRKKAKGIDLKTPAREFSHYTEEEMAETFSYDPRKMLNLRETLDACCENEAERTIIRMREEGYVDREIAEVLGLPLTTTYVMRRTLYARFLELTGWEGEA